MNDITKTAQALEDSEILLKGVPNTIKNGEIVSPILFCVHANLCVFFRICVSINCAKKSYVLTCCHLCTTFLAKLYKSLLTNYLVATRTNC